MSAGLLNGTSDDLVGGVDELVLFGCSFKVGDVAEIIFAPEVVLEGREDELLHVGLNSELHVGVVDPVEEGVAL
jgi:hypothetical protein